MADWDGLRGELERSVAAPPLSALRARRQRRQQRRTIAVTCALAMIGTASGAALLGRAAERARVGEPLAAPPTDVSRIVNGAPLPPPRDYRDHVVTDVDFVSATTGWAIGIRCVGDACDVASWRTEDGGRTWSAPVAVANGVPRASFHEEDPAGGAVRSLRMVDGLRGYAFNPDLYVTADGGRTWRRDPRPSKVASVSVVGETVWVTEHGCPRDDDCDVVVRTGTVGGTLRPLAVPETNGALALVRRAGALDGYLLAWDAPEAPHAAFHVTRDGGRTWQERTHPCPDATAALLSTAALRPLWLVCTTPAGRRVFQSADAGTTWRQAGSPPAGGEVTDLVATSATHAYLTLQDPGRLLVTTDGGRTWRPADGTGDAFGYANVDLTGDGSAWAMGDAGHLWHTADGTRWERRALPPGAPRAAPRPTPSAPDDRDVTFTSLHFLDANRGWALGHRCARGVCRAVLRRTTDGGVTWTRAPGPRGTWRPADEPLPPNRVAGVMFADERTGWAFGHHVFATHDGGATWREVSWGYVFDVVPRGAVYWSVGYEGCLSNPCGPFAVRARIGDDTPDPLPGFEAGLHVGSFAAVDERHAYFVDGYAADPESDGPDPVVTGTADGGRTWQRHPAPCRRSAARRLSAYAPGGLWIVCGALADDTQWQAKSSDGGRTWTTTRLPGRGASVGRIVALSETVAWRTGANAGLLVTRDGGATWEAVPGFGKVAQVTFADAEHGWALDEDGYVHRTTDGVTWERLGRP